MHRLRNKTIKSLRITISNQANPSKEAKPIHGRSSLQASTSDDDASESMRRYYIVRIGLCSFEVHHEAFLLQNQIRFISIKLFFSACFK